MYCDKTTPKSTTRFKCLHGQHGDGLGQIYCSLVKWNVHFAKQICPSFLQNGVANATSNPTLLELVTVSNPKRTAVVVTVLCAR